MKLLKPGTPDQQFESSPNFKNLGFYLTTLSRSLTLTFSSACEEMETRSRLVLIFVRYFNSLPTILKLRLQNNKTYGYKLEKLLIKRLFSGRQNFFGIINLITRFIDNTTKISNFGKHPDKNYRFDEFSTTADVAYLLNQILISCNIGSLTEEEFLKFISSLESLKKELETLDDSLASRNISFEQSFEVVISIDALAANGIICIQNTATKMPIDTTAAEPDFATLSQIKRLLVLSEALNSGKDDQILWALENLPSLDDQIFDAVYRYVRDQTGIDFVDLIRKKLMQTIN